MKMEEATANNVDTNIALLNDLLAKMSGDPNESVESRFGRLIDHYFEGDTQRFLTCMELPLGNHQILFYLKPDGDQDLITCPRCRKAEEHLLIGSTHWYICHQHRARWKEERELLSPGAWDRQCYNWQLGQILEKEDEEKWDRIKDYRDLNPCVTEYPEDSRSQQEETSESSKGEPNPLSTS